MTDKQEQDTAGHTVPRYVRAEGATLDDMRANFRKTDLYRAGDALLVWINEGDLYLSPSKATS
jgi:hypothetical protein